MEEKEKELSGALANVHYKLSKAKSQVVMVAQEGMVPYKATKECHNDQMQYATITYLIEKNEI